MRHRANELDTHVVTPTIPREPRWNIGHPTRTDVMAGVTSFMAKPWVWSDPLQALNTHNQQKQRSFFLRPVFLISVFICIALAAASLVLWLRK